MISDSTLLHTSLGPAVLRRSSRRTLAISVLPNGNLELTAPHLAQEREILAKVGKRRRWIVNQRRKFAAMNSQRPEPRYINGATHRYLGRQYRLKVIRGEELSVLLKGAYFHITSPNGTDVEVRKALEKWFRQKAAEQFSKKIDKWIPWCAKHTLPVPRVRILKMPKRWGSAAQDGRIALNPQLIHMPSPCIDYVITHEVCHLLHPNHGPKFVRLLTSLMPDWKYRKERIERSEFV
jgi:predicted metal-dependent hydrolase